jgi:hypothetical protein
MPNRKLVCDKQTLEILRHYRVINVVLEKDEEDLLCGLCEK